MARSRRVIAWVSVTLDGYTSGPDGPMHDTWLHEHAMHEQTGAYFEGIWRGVDTVLLGRKNFEGFASVWPGLLRDPATDERSRAMGTWLAAVERVVLSRTLETADWDNARVARDLGTEVKALKEAPGRDIMALCSASVIQELLRLDLVDDIRTTVVPAIVGGGLRLFPEGLPASRWTPAESTTFAHGAIGVHYRRA